eukprot:TRINITY_DN112515_c0_g1_i1.p1 TRINITY_DN112515_c0_g1~~TRINITY_DN112515_c0_g1_i1.p1  ORF type:complete len:426 (-),score=203.92 TRINITY_DN112515_c0_g1_i1:59-1336(-)
MVNTGYQVERGAFTAWVLCNLGVSIMQARRWHRGSPATLLCKGFICLNLFAGVVGLVRAPDPSGVFGIWDAECLPIFHNAFAWVILAGACIYVFVTIFFNFANDRQMTRTEAKMVPELRRMWRTLIGVGLISGCMALITGAMACVDGKRLYNGIWLITLASGFASLFYILYWGIEWMERTLFSYYQEQTGDEDKAREELQDAMTKIQYFEKIMFLVFAAVMVIQVFLGLDDIMQGGDDIAPPGKNEYEPANFAIVWFELLLMDMMIWFAWLYRPTVENRQWDVFNPMAENLTALEEIAELARQEAIRSRRSRRADRARAKGKSGSNVVQESAAVPRGAKGKSESSQHLNSDQVELEVSNNNARYQLSQKQKSAYLHQVRSQPRHMHAAAANGDDDDDESSVPDVELVHQLRQKGSRKSIGPTLFD